MALDATALRDLIDTEYASINTDYANSSDRNTIKEGLMQAIAKAIVDHFVANAQVNVPDGTAGSDALTGTVS